MRVRVVAAMTATCTNPKCGRYIDAAALIGGFTTHPGCDLTDAQLAANAIARRDERRAAAANANPQHTKAALRIIREYAEQHQRISANDVRMAMDEAGVVTKVRGGAWNAAISQGLIEPEVFIKSTGRTAHAKAVVGYLSLVYMGEKTA